MINGFEHVGASVSGRNVSFRGRGVAGGREIEGFETGFGKVRHAKGEAVVTVMLLARKFDGGAKVCAGFTLEIKSIFGR
jgi:hypothetical protein